VNFRNYASLDLPLQPGLTVLHGQNAQGKTNVVEAIYLLSSGSSYRALSDKEVIRWGAPDGERLARVSGLVGDAEIEVVVADMPGVAAKRALVNGAGKRLADFVGRLTSVLFGPEQLDLVTGSPSNRRAYVDGALSQTDRNYFRTLAVYNRVLQQRNQLLKLFREREVHPDELVYWDAQLVEAGSLISARRARCLQQLSTLAAHQHGEAAAGSGWPVPPRRRFKLSFGSGWRWRPTARCPRASRWLDRIATTCCSASMTSRWTSSARAGSSGQWRLRSSWPSWR
jgi:DNA replication and repair protein RecF